MHLYYFTRTTITRLLENSGFDVLVAARPHYQRLSLGYVLRRASAYVGTPATIAARMAAVARLSDIQVP